jgi:hypothetical protein
LTPEDHFTRVQYWAPPKEFIIIISIQGKNTSPDIVSMLWKTGTMVVFPLSFLTETCEINKRQNRIL